MQMSLQEILYKKIWDKFKPSFLDVINESYMHNVPKGSDSHYKVIIASDAFKNLSLLKRHRLINETLQAELNTTIHALSIVAKTPEQWEQDPHTYKSPKCLGGMNNDSVAKAKIDLI